MLFMPFSVYAQDELILGGDSVGIEIGYGGLYVSGTYDIGEDIHPADVFAPGDIIVALDHQTVKDMDAFYAILKQHQDPGQYDPGHAQTCRPNDRNSDEDGI